MLKSLLRKLVPLCMLLSVSVLVGCALTPAPVFLSEHEEDAALGKTYKLDVAVVVEDSRIGDSSSRLCGIKRNAYMMPTSIAFLANSDNFDAILAKDLKEILLNAGYKVSYVSPVPPSELSAEQLDEKSVKAVEGDELDTIGEVQESKTQGLPNSGKQAAEMKTLSASGARDIAALNLPEETDAVLFIDVGSFSSDALHAFFFVSIQGWADLKAEVWDTSPKLFMTGTAVNSWGTSGPRQIITDDCYTIAMNMSYQMGMDKEDE